MFSGKRTRRFTPRQPGRFLHGVAPGAVRYAAEPLEGRVLLTTVIYDSPESQLPPDGQDPFMSEDVIVDVPTTESHRFIERLASHTLTAADMQAHGIAEVEWRGRRRYARPHEWIVDLDLSSAEGRAASEILDGAGLGSIFQRTLGGPDVALIKLPSGESGASLASAFRGTNLLESVAPNGIMRSLATPNDSQYSTQWPLNNSGQNNGIPDADIDAPEAWDVVDTVADGTDVVIGVLDSGIDYKHVDLYKNIWINQAEIPSARLANLTDLDGDALITFWDLNNAVNKGDGKISDQNGNGIIDGWDVIQPYNSDGTGGWADTVNGGGGELNDIIGWNFSDSILDLGARDTMDTGFEGHGTHVAGIIGAIGNNSTGISGVLWKTQLMPIRIANQNQYTEDAWVIEGINYAKALKNAGTANIRVLNISYGDDGWDGTAFDTAIGQAGAAGIIVVAAAGNETVNNDVTPYYPATSALGNVISVASTDRFDMRADSSHWGPISVDLGAPGVQILSTLRNNTYGVRGGTSQAAPHERAPWRSPSCAIPPPASPRCAPRSWRAPTGTPASTISP